jgi:hypothetical protein
VVIDHHKTAAEELGGMPGIHINQEKSAAVLAWEYFHPQTSVPELMAYVQVRDLWLFARSEDPRWRAGAREVAAALDVYLHTFTAWSELVDGGDKAVARLKEMGAGVLTLISRQADRMAGLHRWAWFTPGGGLQILPPNSELNRAVGYVVPVANASCFGSEVCEMLMRRFPSAPFVGYYSDVPTGGRKWGLRSRNNVDVSAIARLFEGGGGHLKAAGFIQTREHIEAGGRFAPGQAAEPMVPQPTLTGEGA